MKIMLPCRWCGILKLLRPLIGSTLSGIYRQPFSLLTSQYDSVIVTRYYFAYWECKNWSIALDTCGEDHLRGDEFIVDDRKLRQLDPVDARYGTFSSPPVELDIICCVAICWAQKSNVFTWWQPNSAGNITVFRIAAEYLHMFYHKLKGSCGINPQYCVIIS